MPAKVKDHMTTELATLREGDPLRAAVELELTRKIRHVPVVNDRGELMGILTDRDIKRVLPTPLSLAAPEEYERILDTTPAGRVMTRDPYTVTPQTDLADAVQIMIDHKVGGLPVLESGALVGIVTQSDALRACLPLLRR